MTTTVNADRKYLENFVVENHEFERLESMLDQFNVFEAIGAVRQEFRHSDFLAFLLNPRQNHGLGDEFLRRLLQIIILAHRDVPLPISLIDAAVWSFDDTTILREWRNIDILLLNERHRLVVILENKVDSSEHSNQLENYYEIASTVYHEYHLMALFLTPDGSPPSDERYLTVSYGQIAKLIEDMLEQKPSSLGDDVRTILAHYTQMLRRHIVNDSEIKKLCEQIYQKHQRALDLIYEHRPDRQFGMWKMLEGLIANSPDIILDGATKAMIPFVPKTWDGSLPKVKPGWSPHGYLVRFWFENKPESLRIVLEIGPGPRDLRERLFNIARRHHPPFIGLLKLSPIYTRIWRSKSLKLNYDSESDDSNGVEAKVRTLWGHFLGHDLPALDNIIRTEMCGDGS